MSAQSTSELRTYLNAIGRFPVLSKESQLLHCRRIQAWVNHPAGRDAAPLQVARAGRRSMDVMLQTNLRLVVSIARKYTNQGLDIADLIQEGSFGLVRGLELFDPTRGYAFTTYAYWWIRQAITRALHTYARTIRLPVNTNETLSRIRKLTGACLHEHRRLPTIDELATALKLSPERVQEILTCSDMTVCGSLDVRLVEDGDMFVAMIPTPNPGPSNTPELALMQDTDSEMLTEAIERLPEVERTIIQGLFFQHRTMQALADELGLSRSQVQTLRYRATKWLKHHLLQSGYRPD